MKTETIPIAQLLNNSGQIDGLPENPRMAKDAKYKNLVKSIRSFPLMQEIRECVVYPHGKKYVVIGGNMRLRACKELGHAEIWCKVLPIETPVEDLQQIAILDNTHAGEFDHDLLANNWSEVKLKEWNVDLPNFEAGEDVEGQGDDFDLKDGDRAPFQQMTFTLADEQAEIIKNAMQDARGLEAFKYAETYANENGNGNALYFIVAEWERLRK